VGCWVERLERLAKGCWDGSLVALGGWVAAAFEAGERWVEVWVQRVDGPESWLGVRLWEAAPPVAWAGL